MRPEDLARLVDEARVEELPEVAAALELARVKLHLRLVAPAPAPVTEILDPDQAARLVGVHKRWLLDSTRGMAFRRDLGHRTKRFDKIGLLTWAKTAVP